MSEVEKMYENAGIKPTKNWQSCLNCKLKTETRYDEWGEEYLTCNRLEMPEKCSDAKEYYPLFTTEKQLELIKWLARNRNGILISNLSEGEYSISTGFYYCAKNIKNFKNNKDLGIVIAIFINDLWQDLTEEERKQIKDILE